MRTRKLGELCQAILSGGTPSTKEPSYWDGDIPWITSADIQEDFTAVPRKFVSATANPNVLPANNILVVTRVGLGKVATSDKPLAFSQDIQGLILKKGVHHRYLVYALSRKVKRFKEISRGATIKGVTRRDLEDIVVPLPDLDTQKQIAHILSQADKARQQRKVVNALTVQFLQSTFLSMFGDLVNNDRRWPVQALIEVAEVNSGVTKGRKLSGTETIYVPYMRVANVQDGALNLTEIKEIEIKKEEWTKYMLHDGDVLLTEGGDPDKLGRGAVWYNQIEGCIYQNHIFRVRADKNIFAPEFLSYQFGSAYGKRYFFKAAKQTTGIASINSTQLKAFPILTPPLKLQQQFADIVAQTEQLRQRQRAHEAELEGMFQSLLQRYFGG